MKLFGLAFLVACNQASEGFLQWIDGDFEDDSLPDVKGLPQPKPRPALVQAKSDPIFGSLGPDDSKNAPLTEEEKVEKDLRSRTPIDFDDDEDSVSTAASIS